MKAEATLSSFSMFADDLSLCVLLEQRFSGWWAVVMQRGANGFEQVRAVRLDSPLDLGALLVATFGGA